MKKLVYVFSLLGLISGLMGCVSSTGKSGSVTLDYEIIGSGSEKVIVLHDWLGDRSNYDPVHPFLDLNTFTYAFLDLRGYGGSMDISGNHTVDEAAADVMGVAEELGWDQFHIVGHSMTGMVVQRLAVDATGQLKSVVAVSPVAASGLPVDEDTWNFFVDVVDNPESTSAGIGLLTGSKLSKSWIDYKVERAMRTSTSEARYDYLEMFVKSDFSAEVVGNKTPILLILGNNDLPAFLPSGVTETFMAWYPNAQIANITDAGHYAMQEAPALFVNTMETFLRENIN